MMARPHLSTATSVAGEAPFWRGVTTWITGPISDQSGTVKVPAGTTMDDAALSGMQWLVQGVDGKLT